MIPTTLQSSTSSLRVREIDPTRDARWQSFIAGHPDASVHHHPLWLDVLREAFGYRPAHLACEDAQGNLRGVLPLFTSQGLLGGTRYSSLPRTPSGGPLASDAEAATALLEAAVARVREERGASLQVKLSHELIRPVLGLSGGRFRETYIVPLPERDQPLLLSGGGRHRGVQSNVKKAARLGVEVREAEHEAELRVWYALYLDTMRYRFVPPRPYRFFALAWQLMRPCGLLRVLLAEQRGASGTRLLAGGVFLQYGASVYYGFAGSSRDDLEVRPNDAMHWRAMCDAHRAGFRAYDMGEVGHGNAGLTKYKQKWGAEQRWLYRYYFPAPRERALAVLEADGRVAQLARQAWQRVPLPMTELVSSVLHRYL